MELASIKSYQRTIASVDLPLKHFVDTGFWNPYVVEGWTDSDIGDTFVRRACREVAKELKRPFIQCFASVSTTESYDTGKKNAHGYPIYDVRPLPEPRFSSGYIEVPKRKYLIPLVAPLLLAAGEPTRRWNQNATAPVANNSVASLWQFRITSEELWNQYYEFVLNDPDCRKARRLTS